MSYYRILIISLFIFSLSACGFRPLHGKFGENDSTADLASIEVKPIADRTGQILRNHLFDILTPYGQPANPKYVLAVQLHESITRIAIEKDAFATRANLNIQAEYSITETATNTELFSSFIKSVSSYNILKSEYSTLISEKNARRRSVKELGDNIKTQLSVYFSRQKQKKE